MKSIKEDLKINLNHLDEDWIALPELYNEYTAETELLDNELKTAKLNFDLYEANLYLLIKREPEEFEIIAKPTETEIKSIILKDAEIKKLKLQILEIEKQKKLIAASAKSLEMKKDAMKALVTLFVAEYWFPPGATETEKESLNEIEETNKKKLRREMKRNLKRNKKQ